ncbi:MAG: ATP-binding domain-containing protein, partial [Gemmatimonadetes bacterium]|nr:ATP-binding domain-containing protein [Gemmatimonadota bacterium]
LMVVGDDDQSIYAWRGADIRNILDFEASFPRASIVRLEENYRSTEKVLEAANQVIRHNVDRKGKNLRTRRKGGEAISVTETLDETDEARWIAGEIESALSQESGREHRSFSVLYRTNAQARALEDAFRVKGLPYQVVGGVGFYERREIQDVLGYLRLISNPRDGVAFDRVVGYPRRGVGSTTVARLRDWAREAGVTLLEGASRASEIPTLPKTGAKGLTEFADLIQRYSARASQAEVGVVLEELVEELDLLRLLREEGPDGDDRAENVKELIAAAMDFEAELLEEDDLPRDRFSDLDFFLQRVSLVADVDLHDPDADSVTLMTLHNAKGLEFPVVFISGMEDGLFPLGRAYDDPASLEEERRLFYVGITRAQDKLYLTHARQRRRAGEYMYGRLSPFVEAIDETLLEERVSSRVKRSFQTGFGVGFGRGAARGRRKERAQEEWDDSFPDEDLNQDLPRFVKGERVSHSTFGSGTVMEVSGFGPDLKVSVKFDSVGVKRLLARYADLEKDYF